jgi:predicted transcriptional regulator
MTIIGKAPYEDHSFNGVFNKKDILTHALKYLQKQSTPDLSVTIFPNITEDDKRQLIEAILIESDLFEYHKRVGSYWTQFKLNPSTIIELSNKSIEQVVNSLLFPKRSFAEQCDIILQLITQPKYESQPLNTTQISEMTGIEYDTVDAIGNKFDEQNLIELSASNGHSVFSITPAAKTLVRETSFVEKKELQSRGNNTYYQTTVPGNNNIIAVGNDHSSFDKSFSPDQSSSPEIKRSKITVESILKIGAAIIMATLAVLKSCGVL